MEVTVTHLPARLRHFRIRAILATLLLAILLVSIPAGQTPFAASERGGSAVVKGRPGFTYTLASVNALDNRISDMRLNGVPIDPAASYRVTITDFLAAGGDGFSRLAVGTQRVVAPGFDVDALVAYLGAASPVPPGPANRITKVN
jgi:2',3'-cyclic-nucleotide 2'-phosphodiesterase (5'-nucleotidase family)